MYCYVERRYAECRYAERRYAECCYVECRGAIVIVTDGGQSKLECLSAASFTG